MKNVKCGSLVFVALVGVGEASAQIPVLRIPAKTYQRMSFRSSTPESRTAKPRPKNLTQWFQQNVLDQIEVTGNRSLGYHAYTVTGDEEAFRTSTYYGNGGQRFTDIGAMTVTGHRVLGLLDFQTQFVDNRIHDPEGSKTTLNYDRGPLKVSLGDIRGSLLSTNRYTRFDRQLYGVMAGYQRGRFQAKILRSEAKGAARTISLQGTNSAGPYYLQSGRILSDTIEVLLDGQPMRLLTDFVVDSELGAITFVNRIIPPTSTLVVTYEASSFNSSRGTIQGAATAYDFGRFGRLGVTAMEQLKGGKASNGFIDDLWEGQGAPSQGYTLAYEPAAGSVSIRVDGVIQVEGIDYVFDAIVKSKFYMTRYVGQTSTVSIHYRPVTQVTVDGDRRVTGVDYRIPIGKKGRGGYVSYSLARGELVNTSSPMSGTAKSLEAEYKVGPLVFRGSVRDVPSTFVNVESRTFSRNEKATDLGVEATLGPWVYGMSTTNSAIAKSTQSGSSSSVNARVSSMSAYARIGEVGGTRWTLEHNRSYSRLTDESRLDTTSLTGARRFGKLNTSLAMDVQNGRGPISNSVDTKIGNLGVQTLRSTLGYEASKSLSLSGRFGVSNIVARGKHGTGTDLTANVDYRPSESFSVNAGVTQSNSGQLATLGSFSNGTGVGYGGNGFSGGATGGFADSAGSNVRLYQVTTQWRLSDRLGFDIRWADSTTEGDLSSNTHTQSFGLGTNWDLGQFHLLSLTLDRTSTTFLGVGSTKSDSTLVSASFTGAPKGRLSYRLGFAGQIAGAQTTYSQNAELFDASVSYRIATRQRASVSFSHSRTTGYYGQLDNSLNFLYSYNIFRSLSLVGGYKIRQVRNLDSTQTSGAYRSSGFDLELSFDFGR